MDLVFLLLMQGASVQAGGPEGQVTWYRHGGLGESRGVFAMVCRSYDVIVPQFNLTVARLGENGMAKAIRLTTIWWLAFKGLVLEW